MKVKGNLDFSTNQAIKLVVEKLSADPTSNLVDGRIWLNETDDSIKIRINGGIHNIATGPNASAVVQALIDLLASTAGAGMIGIADSAGNTTATNVEAAIADIFSKIASSGNSYTYNSASDQSIHVINHGLNSKYVGVTVYDKFDDQVILPRSITAVDLNNLSIEFSSPLGIVAKITT